MDPLRPPMCAAITAGPATQPPVVRHRPVVVATAPGPDFRNNASVRISRSAPRLDQRLDCIAIRDNSHAPVCRLDRWPNGTAVPDAMVSPALRRLRQLRLQAPEAPALRALRGMYFEDVLARVPNANFLFLGDSLMLELYKMAVCSVAQTGGNCTTRRDMTLEHVQPDENVLNETMLWRGADCGLAVVQHKFLGLYSLKAAQQMLETADVVVLNFGVHYAAMDALYQDMLCLLRMVRAYAALESKLVVLLDAAAQHFAGPSGDGAYDTAVYSDVCRCDPLQGANATAVNKYNAALRAALAAADPAGTVPILPRFALTAPLWNWHFGNLGVGPTNRTICDCTHYCVGPMHERIFEMVAAEIDRKWPRGRSFYPRHPAP